MEGNKIKKFIIIFLIVILVIIGRIAFYLSQNYKTIGYVVEVNENSLLIISERGYIELQKKIPSTSTKNRIDSDLRTEYTDICIPKINKFFHSKFEKNEKVKVFSEPMIIETGIPTIEANLITKME